MKVCSKCGETKDLESFVKDKRRHDGRGSWCKPCNAARSRVRKPPVSAPTDGEKTCISCGETKPVTDFPPRPDTAAGIRSECRSCTRERTRLAIRRMRERDPERALLLAREWRKANPEKEKARYLAYDEAHREERRQAMAKSRQENPEHHRKLRRKWREANLDKYRERCRAYWHRKRAQTSDDSALVDFYAEQLRSEPCHYCGACGNTTIDHVVPISKGGAHSIENIVPACQPCNSSKGAKPLDEWLGTLKSS